jgi:cAMP-dependent protein kinase regulator
LGAAEVIKKRRIEADQAFEAGRLREALSGYQDLEQLEPENPLWAQRMAQVYQRSGKKHDKDQIAALARAAAKFAQAGDLARAASSNRAILEIDPAHPQARTRLEELNQALARRPISEPTPAATSPAAFAALARPMSAVARPLGPLGPLEEARRAAATRAQAILQKVPLFSTLDPASLGRLIAAATPVSLPSGGLLFRQGDAGEAMYVIAGGQIGLYAEGPPRVELARFGEGSFFGEISLVARTPRSATAEAMEDSWLFVIDRTVVTALSDVEPKLIEMLYQFVSERLLDRLFQTSPLFKDLNTEERVRLASRFTFSEVAPNSVLIAEGELTAALYILAAGALNVVQGVGTPQPLLLSRLLPGDVCGEISLLFGTPAAATVHAPGEALVLELPRSEFAQVMREHPSFHLVLHHTALRRRQANRALHASESQA